MKNFVLKIGIAILNGIYCIIKLFPTKQNKITFISRQSNQVSLDFKMLAAKLKEKDENLQIVFLCKTLGKSIKKEIAYSFHMIRQMYHIATSKVVILDSYCIPICILKHKKGLVVFQIWHALGSLKKFGYSTLDKKDGRSSKIAKTMKMHKNYTYILTSSSVSKKFFQEAFGAKDKQMIIGNLPRVDFLKSDKVKQKMIKKFQKSYPETQNGKKNILYCPTKRKDTAIPIEEMIKDIPFDKYNFIVKLHDGKEVVFVDGVKIARGKFFTGLELLHVADYIITDYSAIVYEAAITKKPIYFYVYDYDTYQIDRGTYTPYLEEMPGPISKDFSEIMKSIQKNQYDVEKIEKFCNKYIENLERNATEDLSNLILATMKGEKNDKSI